ncbi:ABC transporter ATP-binding protein [Thioalkalivibrio thiocyanodenitrificans]|uniref:ABC transporter ATP-binding protein n=1 Tax=Thioalkalivibrio thiocyanodenitrificans TaxID=243063 RepID=UPI00037201B8
MPLTTPRRILDLLTPAERRRGYLLLGMILMMAFLEVLGVASILPFLAVLANMELVHTNAYLSAAYELLGFRDPERFLFFLGVLVFVFFVVSTLFKALTHYAIARYANMREYALSMRLTAGYLNQPYEWYLDRHSADLGKMVLSEVGQVVQGGLMPMLHVIAHGTVVLAILMLLVVVDPGLATVVALGLGGAYVAIYMLLRRYLGHLGADRVKANQERFRVVQETFGGVKEIKLSGTEGRMLARFQRPARRFATRQAAAQVARRVPRFGLEVVVFGGMLAVVLYLMAGEGGLQQALPVIALYAFAGYRLIPALQTVYGDLANLRFAEAAVEALHRDLTGLAPGPGAAGDGEGAEPLRVHRAVRLEGVTYTYPGADSPVLRDLGLEIPAQHTVGLVGATGSGKTTAVDVILGLLRPRTGRVLVDDEPLGADNLRAWQRNLGYVPQRIYLADDTVAANIAFGRAHDEIDLSAVEQAARVANLHDFVVSELPDGYETRIGERGIRLSGGQCQRIGIARALYRDPQVLIMDEATSALDNLTEFAVMEAVHNLGRRKTIILIAHRLSTVRECDRIYLLDKGRVIGQGSYDELIESSERFRAMAAVR